MPRLTKVHTDEFKLRILDAAESLLIRSGVEGLTARAIASELACSTGKLYSYFPAVSDIALAVLSRNLERLNTALRSMTPDMEGVARLHGYADVYMEFIDRNAVSWQALFDYRRDHPETGTPEWYLGKIVDLTRIVAGCFSDISRGRAEPKACADQALLLWAGVYGLTLLDEEKRFDTIIGGDRNDRVHKLVDVHVSAWKASTATG